MNPETALQSGYCDCQLYRFRLHSVEVEYLASGQRASISAKELSEERVVAIEFTSECFQRSPRDIAFAIFRVCKKASTNAVKHSGSKHFEVRDQGTTDEFWR